jgi:hypothetical protein
MIQFFLLALVTFITVETKLFLLDVTAPSPPKRLTTRSHSSTTVPEIIEIGRLIPEKRAMLREEREAREKMTVKEPEPETKSQATSPVLATDTSTNWF